MKKSHSAFILSLFTLTLLLSSCSYRSPSGVWEDTKTAGRYIGRSVRALAGKQEDSRMIHDSRDFRGPDEEEFIPLQNDAAHNTLKYERESYPIAKDTPGETNSLLPGIDFFNDPDVTNRNVFKQLHFDTNKHNVRGAENIEILDSIAAFLKNHPDYYVYSEGHCDLRGTANYNMALGVRRANMVRNELIERGVSLNKIFTVSYGKEYPIALGESANDLQQNRRVQFKLYRMR